MQTVLVTGSSGFIGRHMVEALGRRPEVRLIQFDLSTPEAELERGLREADVILHLAGVNRPQNPDEFKAGNTDFTTTLCKKLAAQNRRPLFILSSSIQAALDNPYGASKRMAEEIVRHWAEHGGGTAIIFRLKNVFGKWCRPNYNSVTATFCHNIAHDLPITISDPAREIELVYIDDVVAAFLAAGDETPETPVRPAGYCEFCEVPRSFKVTLGELAARIGSFRASRHNLQLPDFADPLNRCLYATYLSYLKGADFAYDLNQKTDPRGSLAEFVKSPSAGQIFVSRTKPGITRGNHFHHTKTEKFLVVEGEAIIRFRHIQGTEIIEHRIKGCDFRVLDIPPGYTHSIENIGAGELVTLFWASEVFDPEKADTYPLSVMG